MRWDELKADVLSHKGARLSGRPAGAYIARSAAGPGAGGSGSVFFTREGRRVRMSLDPSGGIGIFHAGDGDAVLSIEGTEYAGRLEQVGFHCPGQAYITVSGGCVFNCRYCPVPVEGGRRKSVEEIAGMVDTVRDRIDAIAITSGVMNSIEDEESYVLDVIRALRPFGIPIGISIYPTRMTPRLLYDEGVAEVKFNVETATDKLFAQVCPGLDRHLLWDVLIDSVALFGRNHVFSNVIIGLSETDEEMEACTRLLASSGVIPVLRPLNPAAGMKSSLRPSKERLLRLAAMHRRVLQENGLHTGLAVTMCTACTGCDMVPGRDIT